MNTPGIIVTNAFCRQMTICNGKKVSAAAWKDMQPSLKEIKLPRFRRTARQGDPAGIKPCPQSRFHPATLLELFNFYILTEFDGFCQHKLLFFTCNDLQFKFTTL